MMAIETKFWNCGNGYFHRTCAIHVKSENVKNINQWERCAVYTFYMYSVFLKIGGIFYICCTSTQRRYKKIICDFFSAINIFFCLNFNGICVRSRYRLKHLGRIKQNKIIMELISKLNWLSHRPKLIDSAAWIGRSRGYKNMSVKCGRDSEGKDGIWLANQAIHSHQSWNNLALVNDAVT